MCVSISANRASDGANIVGAQDPWAPACPGEHNERSVFDTQSQDSVNE
jgi:hypothetical protein